MKRLINECLDRQTNIVVTNKQTALILQKLFLDKYTNINNDILQTDIENSLTDVSLKGINRQLHIQVDRQMKTD